MKKIKIDGAKLQLHKQQIATLNVTDANRVVGGATGTTEITPSGPIVLSPNCPVNPGTAWCPISDPPPPRPGG